MRVCWRQKVVWCMMHGHIINITVLEKVAFMVKRVVWDLRGSAFSFLFSFCLLELILKWWPASLYPCSLRIKWTNLIPCSCTPFNPFSQLILQTKFMLFHKATTQRNNVEQYSLGSFVAYKNEIQPYRVHSLLPILRQHISFSPWNLDTPEMEISEVC